jgi:hypothetical protein
MQQAWSDSTRSGSSVLAVVDLACFARSAPILVEVTGHPQHPSRARAPGVERTPPRLRRQRRSTIGRAAAKPDDDGPLVRAENSMENDRVADSEETDPEAGKVFDVPDPDTGRSSPLS